MAEVHTHACGTLKLRIRNGADWGFAGSQQFMNETSNNDITTAQAAPQFPTPQAVPLSRRKSPGPCKLVLACAGHGHGCWPQQGSQSPGRQSAWWGHYAVRRTIEGKKKQSQREWDGATAVNGQKLPTGCKSRWSRVEVLGIIGSRTERCLHMGIQREPTNKRTDPARRTRREIEAGRYCIQHSPAAEGSQRFPAPHLSKSSV